MRSYVSWPSTDLKGMPIASGEIFAWMMLSAAGPYLHSRMRPISNIVMLTAEIRYGNSLPALQLPVRL